MQTKCLLLLFVLFLLSTSSYGQSYEVPAVYKTKDVIPEKLRSGKDFQLEPTIGHNGFLYLINVHSAYGDYSVKGLASLENLIYELQVLSTLQEIASSNVFIDAAGKSSIDIVKLPIKTAGELFEAAANPGETLETIGKLPDGIVGIFDWARNRVVSATDDVSYAFSSKNEQEKADNDSLVEKGVDSLEKLSLDYLGYNKLQRAWCEQTNVDPYTTNAPLRDRIARFAEVETAVKLGFKFVPGINLGAVGKVKGYMDKTRKVSLFADPTYANDQNKLILKEMGIADPEIKQFFRNKKFSSTMRTLLIDQLDQLANVENRNAILGVASEIASKEGALFLVQSVKYLVKVQTEGTKFERFLLGAHAPAILTSTGSLIVPLALDRIIWIREMDETISDIVLKAKEDKSIKKIDLLTSAKLSKKMKQELVKKGVKFTESVAMEL